MVFARDVAHYGLKAPEDAIRAEALEWAITRASRSGRAAFEFIQDLAGRLGRSSTSARTPVHRTRASFLFLRICFSEPKVRVSEYRTQFSGLCANPPPSRT